MTTTGGSSARRISKRNEVVLIPKRHEGDFPPGVVQLSCGSKCEELHVSTSLPVFTPKADINGSLGYVTEGPCVDGSGLARAFFTMADLVGGTHVFGLCVRLT
jgi:hypothetical protein